MSYSIEEFYDRLADEYHLIFGRWDETVKWQGQVLDMLLRAETGRDSLSVLDCSCGIGTQAIGLALMGHRLTATDLSPRSVERAKAEVERFGVEIAFRVADFRTLELKLRVGLPLSTSSGRCPSSSRFGRRGTRLGAQITGGLCCPRSRLCR